MDLSPSLFESSCVGWETWQGKVYQPPISVSVKSKLLAKLGVSKLENAFAQVQEQFKDKEWKDRRRKGEQLHCRQSGWPCFRPGKGSFQRSGTSRLGAKGERRNGQTQGSTRHVHYLRKVPTIKKFAVHLLFSESHAVFSVLLFCDCSFNCFICITCFWILVLALGSPEWRQEQGMGLGLFTDVALVLARPFQTETILFQWMKIETTRLLFG